MRTATRIQFAIFSLAHAAVGCSSSTTNNTVVATCGPGTTLVDGTCVVEVDGGAGDSSPNSEVSASDTGGTDTAKLETGGADSTTDAATDGAKDALAPADPCPTLGPKVINCRAACGPVDARCDALKCQLDIARPVVLADIELTKDSMPLTIVLPDVDLADYYCDHAVCGPDAVRPAYGFAFRVVNSPDYAQAVIRSEAPWDLGTFTPESHYCANWVDRASAYGRRCFDISATDTVLITTNVVSPGRTLTITPVDVGTITGCP